MKSKTLEIIKNNIQIVADQIERLTAEDTVELMHEVLIETFEATKLRELEPQPEKPEYRVYIWV